MLSADRMTAWPSPAQSASSSEYEYVADFITLLLYYSSVVTRTQGAEKNKDIDLIC